MDTDLLRTLNVKTKQDAMSLQRYLEDGFVMGLNHGLGSFSYETLFKTLDEFLSTFYVEAETTHSLKKVVSMLPKYVRDSSFFPRKGVVHLSITPSFFMCFPISTPRDIRKTYIHFLRKHKYAVFKK